MLVLISHIEISNRFLKLIIQDRPRENVVIYSGLLDIHINDIGNQEYVFSVGYIRIS